MSLPRDSLGAGLRPVHFSRAFTDPSGVDFFEVIAENYLESGPIPAANLMRACEVRPVALHGVSLDLCGSDPLDSSHLQAVNALVNRIDAPCFTDHLCWTRIEGWHSHDLLPVPFTPANAEHAAARARKVQESLSVPFGIENLSSYAGFASSTMTEWDFYSRVVREAGVHLLLDINNIHVSASNHGFDPVAYLEAVDWDRVLYVHLAGHTVRGDGLRIDTHDAPVSPEVWELYRKAWSLGGPFPTMVEWDGSIPSWDRLREEVQTARTVRGGRRIR